MARLGLTPFGFSFPAAPLFLGPTAPFVSIIALFDTFPIGARIEIGMDAGF
ncbi:hypothetical protein ACHOLT_18525 [Desulfitobacterium sp. Sab5]|uniref:hypothetical protein n=1 Tax=Desulfitobacterium nosdiversum TaxID=3375356 RepID=UPI003CF5E443